MNDERVAAMHLAITVNRLLRLPTLPGTQDTSEFEHRQLFLVGDGRCARRTVVARGPLAWASWLRTAGVGELVLIPAPEVLRGRASRRERNEFDIAPIGLFAFCNEPRLWVPDQNGEPPSDYCGLRAPGPPVEVNGDVIFASQELARELLALATLCESIGAREWSGQLSDWAAMLRGDAGSAEPELLQGFGLDPGVAALAHVGILGSAGGAGTHRDLQAPADRIALLQMLSANVARACDQAIAVAVAASSVSG